MKKTIGILAHVDAGKTTFSEQALFHAHALRAPGRVDHRDTFLDIHPLEKARGITIFSDQACFEYGGDTWYWVDTPGHVDFSTEMERAVSVMDYAVLVVSCAAGVQSHTETVWRLLERYSVPAFLFLNKTDRAGADPEAALRAVRDRLSGDVLDLRGAFGPDGALSAEAAEAVAANDEALLEAWLADGYDRETWLDALREQVRRRQVFPLMAGSALKDEGVGEFLRMLSTLTRTEYHLHTENPFLARASKVRFDAQGGRMVFLKIIAGRLNARDEIMTPEGPAKVNELRVYNGAKYRTVPSAEAGDLVAAAGLAGVRPGDLVGARCERSRFLIEPVMAARVLFPAEVHPTRMLECLRRLEEEEPTLGVAWNEGDQSVELQVMGAIQLEVIRDLVRERFGVDIDFGPCRVRYMETIAAPAYGIGHYEPLRHYAEVHLRLDPGPRGSGIGFASDCHVDDLALNWQRLIETHVFEYAHKGVLTGAPLTDVKITLLAGRAHLKHTEGGDFRQAVYRGIRNALMGARNVLLEPVCRFELRAPAEALGRVLSDLTRLHADAGAPEFAGEDILIRGEAPAARLNGYAEQLAMLTHGRGSFAWRLDHYAPCEDAEAVIAERAYNPLADDTPDSVFCAHGAGFNVPWDRVREYAHLSSEATSAR